MYKISNFKPSRRNLGEVERDLGGQRYTSFDPNTHCCKLYIYNILIRKSQKKSIFIDSPGSV